MKHFVYKFIDADENLLYVGETNNVANRYDGHRGSEHYKLHDKVYYVELENKHLARYLEKFLIRKLKPKCNVTNADNVSYDLFELKKKLDWKLFDPDAVVDDVKVQKKINKRRSRIAIMEDDKKHFHESNEKTFEFLRATRKYLVDIKRDQYDNLMLYYKNNDIYQEVLKEQANKPRRSKDRYVDRIPMVTYACTDGEWIRTANLMVTYVILKSDDPGNYRITYIDKNDIKHDSESRDYVDGIIKQLYEAIGIV